MKTIVYKDYKELSIATAKQIARLMTEKPDTLLCLPAGETSLGTFNELVRMDKDGEVNFSNCKIVGLDEWLYLGEMKKENCYHFLKKNLFDHINIKNENLCFFDGEAYDLQYQCEKTDLFIKTNGDIDVMLLGVGMNGHLGLNEPGTPFNNYSHVVELDEVTKSVGQKYFSEPTELSQGITLGMKHIMETKEVIVQLSGQKKADIVKRLLETEVTPTFPASIIKKHLNSFLLLDSDTMQSQAI